MLKLLETDSVAKREAVTSTFKNTRIINQQSVETVHSHTLDFRVTHRFGIIGTGSNSTSSYHNLWGFDESSDIRIAFEYGVTNNFTVGFSRSKYQENWELLGKMKFLEQTSDNYIPVSAVFFSNIAYSTRQDLRLKYDNPSTSVLSSRRCSFTEQLIIARKFSRRLSLQILGSYIHRNFVITPDDNDVFSLGLGGRWRVTHSTALVADYIYNFGELRQPGNAFHYYNPLGMGFEFETGGHVFSLMFTNAFSIIENSFIPNTFDTWTKGGFRFSFNISRNFKISSSPEKP